MTRSGRTKFSRSIRQSDRAGAIRAEWNAASSQGQLRVSDEAEFVVCELTIYGYMRAFADAGVWESMRHQLVVMLREQDGREASPTAAIIDMQSVKTTEKGGVAATTRRRR